jgi:hypothetical protein
MIAFEFDDETVSGGNFAKIIVGSIVILDSLPHSKGSDK